MSRKKPTKLTMSQKTALNNIRQKFGEPKFIYYQGNYTYCEFATVLYKWDARSEKWLQEGEISAQAETA
jgi:hypothetical protein